MIPLRLWAWAILSGVLQVLPFPIAGPVPGWRTAFCWIAITPLLLALTGKDVNGRPLRAIQGAALGYASGFVWYLGNCYWVYETMNLYGGIAKPAAAGILVLFCLYLGLYHALFGALIAWFRRAHLAGHSLGVLGALLLSPFAWVAVELARARITGFPWDLLGITQVDNLLLTRLAPYFGAYVLSFAIAAVNALWLVRITLKKRRYTVPALTLAFVGLILLYAFFLRRVQPPIHQGTQATATLLQENLGVGAMAARSGPPLTQSEMLRTFSELSLFPLNSGVCNGIPEMSGTRCSGPAPMQQSADSVGTRYLQPTDLIVWPEAPTDFYEIDPTLRATVSSQEFHAAVSSLARAAHAPVIVGAIGFDADIAAQSGYDQYNSAVFIAPDGRIVGRYDKMHLVPFGEYVPYRKLFFFAGKLLDEVGDLEPGTRRSVFTTGGHSIGTFICYESVFADEMRQYARIGADVLVNISDDGWYGDTSAAWEHLNMVRMRAIENHRWVLRATNTGITAAIDPYGRVVLSAQRHRRTSLRVGFDYEHDVTFYSTHGDLFAYFCALITAGGLGLGLLRRST
jgi:apolipoprotein N-acyltransferase